MRLSVILPFYDEVAFLRTALLSIMAQGLPDLQVIVVNDNPERFSDADIRPLLLPGVALVHHDINRGLSAARNTGMAAATGDLVAFLDSDDYFLAGGLARQYDRAVATGADITHGSAARTNPGRPDLWHLGRDKTMFSTPIQGEGVLGLERAQFFVSSWSSIYRADFLRARRLAFDVEQVKFEDRLFVVQSVFAAGQIAVTGGAPVRAWRMRGGSISVTAPDLRIHGLQMLLVEKCMRAVADATARDSLPPRFLRRELFNTLSRLIWDMTLLEDAVGNPDPGYQALLDRIPALLGDDSFSASFFDDRVIAPISRVGAPSRWGKVSRVAFLNVHAALRAGDAKAALAILQERKGEQVPVAPFVAQGAGPELTLHVGLHKTGTTYVQRQLVANRDRLLQAGILVPLAGLDDRGAGGQTRPGGFAGHLGMARHVRDAHAPFWQELRDEIAATAPRRVVISCENLTFPLNPDRADRIAALADRLREVGFSRVSLVAAVRRPDAWAESLWRETVTLGRRDGGQSVTGFLIDHGAMLRDLPRLLGPIEAATGATARLVDFDAAKSTLWAQMAAAMDLPEGLPEDSAATRYASPQASVIAGLQVLATVQPEDNVRFAAAAAFIRACASLDLPPDAPFMTAAERVAMVEGWLAASTDWAAARGLQVDAAGWQAAAAAPQPAVPTSLPMALIDALSAAVAMAEPPGGRVGHPTPAPSGELPLSGWLVDMGRRMMPHNLRRSLRPMARKLLAPKPVRD